MKELGFEKRVCGDEGTREYKLVRQYIMPLAKVQHQDLTRNRCLELHKAYVKKDGLLGEAPVGGAEVLKEAESEW